jgi:hypothetical protein
VVKRVFEIELDIPDDFASEYGPFYTLTPRTVINNGDLVWTIYCDRRKPEPQWIKAEAKDEGKQARFRDTEACKWEYGKLLHFGPCSSADLPYLGLVAVEGGSLFPEWFRECEVQI